MAHAICASVDLMRGDEGIARRLQLDLLIQTLRSSLQQLLQNAPAHWQLAPSSTAIQPLIVGDNASALQLSALLREQGFWVTAIRPPTVAAGTARLRFTLSAAHTREDIEQLMAAFQVAIKGLGA
jgi:8-amino-7-oxononanoate synthase